MPAKAKSGNKKTKVVEVVVPKSRPKKNHNQPSSKGHSVSRGGNIFGTMGALAGGFLGGPPGAILGRAAGDLGAKLSGFGDYRIQKNSLLTGPPPSFSSSGDSFLFSKTEFLTDVTGSVGFSINSYPINPGIYRSFPICSYIAAIFEEYEPDGIVYLYRPSSGSALSSANPALGVFVMATNYDALDPPFASKQDMESYEYATSNVPFAEGKHPVECARGKGVLDNLYVRTGNPPSGSDLRMYDQGTFYYATQGMQGAYVIGELWVAYRFKFRKPRLPPTVSSPLFYSHITEFPIQSAASATLFGTTGGVFTSGSNLPGIQAVANGTSLIFSQTGDYNVFISAESTGAISTPITWSFGANVIQGTDQWLNFGQNYSRSFETPYTHLIMSVTVLTAGSTSLNYLNLISCTGFTAGYLDCFIYPGSSGPMIDRNMLRTARFLRRMPPRTQNISGFEVVESKDPVS